MHEPNTRRNGINNSAGMHQQQITEILNDTNRAVVRAKKDIGVYHNPATEMSQVKYARVSVNIFRTGYKL